MRIRTATLPGQSTALGWAPGQACTVSIDRPEAAGGQGLGFNGGQLLFLAIAGCYSNDVFREAARRGLVVHRVEVEVEGEWGGEPVRAQGVRYRAHVTGDAPESELRALLEHTDRVAEIPNSLRLGTEVTLEAVTVARE
ncbi:MAG TPA: OsmC family protein [Gemmatimonadales bacterium]